MQTNAFQLKARKFYFVPAAAFVAVQLALGSAQAADTPDNRGQFKSSDYKFAKAAACGGMMEVNLGKIAAERSTNGAVQQFGQRMMRDHGKAGEDLQQIATRYGATLPSEPSSGQQKEIDKLNRLSSAEFDKAYINLMVKDHKEDAKEFKKASEDVKNSDLKSFAAATFVIVQDHLKMAVDLEQDLKQKMASK